MLYVFHVDAGTMSTFDMNIALQSVAYLKQAIEKKTRLPANSLVLLVSGGEVLQSDQKVSSYSAGTDTNPIFMFSKSSIRDEATKPAPQCSNDYECSLSPISDLSPSVEMRGVDFGLKSIPDLRPVVEAYCGLPPSHTTVAKCAQLAQQFGDIAVDISRSCQQLVHDQHLQYQGWLGVVANLEDIFHEFSDRSTNFKESFKRHRKRKETYHKQLGNLRNVLEELKKIPMLPALQVNAAAHRFTAFDEFDDGFKDLAAHYYPGSDNAESVENRPLADFGVHALNTSEEDVFSEVNPFPQAASSENDITGSDEGVTFTARSYDDKDTLYHWIMAKHNQASLEDILDYCTKGLALMDADPCKESEVELLKVLEIANIYGLKEIKGIETRLSGLEELMLQVRRTEKEQVELEHALVQNRERVSSVSDSSVLVTLCSSHRHHMHSMLKKHETLTEVRRRIAKSKEELSLILKARLGAVLKIENLMSQQDAHRMLNFQCFNRLAQYFDIVAQLHSAPELFALAVHEVSRRRLFSDAFLQWASELACHLLTIHNDEVLRRQEFNSQFHGHFLSSLFPGTEEMPPDFACQPPQEFDKRLPTLRPEDVEYVKRTFPDALKDVSSCNMDSVIEFFKSRMGPSVKYGKKEQGLTEMVQAGLEKGFDSETETGEFERLSRQSTTEKQRMDVSTSCLPDTAVVSTITEDNMDTHKLNIEKLNEFLLNLYQLCKMNIVFMREELAKIRADQEEQRKFVNECSSDILKAWLKSREESALRFREETQKLTVDHELELSDMQKVVSDKDQVIFSLQDEYKQLQKIHDDEKENLRKSHQDTKDLLEKRHNDIKNLEKKLEGTDIQKQKELKELQDKMHLDYKAEIESLRSRFRLVALTNMDRSPSESSLEKIERTDMIEITSHNAIVLQTKENMEVEKEEAVNEAIEKANKEFKIKLNYEMDKIKSKYESEKQVTLNEAVRRIIDEKDRQLDQLKEREVGLVRECMKYKETIEQLTDPETNDYETLLKSQVASLEKEKTLLAAKVEELQRELEKRSASEEKEEKKDDDTDGSGTSMPRKPPAEKSSRGRGVRSHTPLGVQPGTLCLSSCLPEHTVMIIWDPTHQNYTVLQEAPVMYFVHSDCLSALDLRLNVRSESERKLYAIATVVNKEYCYAKKSGNRYHVPRGSRFYRVRVKPTTVGCSPPACCEHRHARSHGSLSLSVFSEQSRPVKKWLTYLHAPDIQKSKDMSQSVSSATETSTSKRSVTEVVTGTLIQLSPLEARVNELEESTSLCMDESTMVATVPEAEEPSDALALLLTLSSQQDEMESSGIERIPDPPPPARLPLQLPLELSVSTQSIVAVTEPHEAAALAHELMDSEIAEEATP